MVWACACAWGLGVCVTLGVARAAQRPVHLAAGARPLGRPLDGE